MTHKLVIVEPAERDVDEIYRYILSRSERGASAWYRAFLACTERVAKQPETCAVAMENSNFHLELRQAMFKTRYGDRYRCVFTIVDEEIRILRVRGRGQSPLQASDVVDS